MAKKKTEIEIKTQAELDALDVNFKGKIFITGNLDKIDKDYPNAEVHIKDSAYVWAVCGSAQIRDVSGSAQIRDVSGSAQISYVSGSAQIRDVSGSAQISYVSGSAQIRDVSGSAQIRDVSGSAQISYVYGSAQISYVYGSAQISYVYGSAQIRDVSGSAQIRDVYGSAQISYVYGSAQISYVYGSAQISYVSGSANVLFLDGDAKVSITGKGNNIVSCYEGCKQNVSAPPTTTIVMLDRFNATWDAYANLFPIKVENGIATMYKMVRKINDKYVSNHDTSFEYVIGQMVTEKCDANTNVECSHGIHVSHRIWAIRFGSGWDNPVLLEMEVDITKVVVPKNCDGKVRTSEAKVIREIPFEDWYK
jgi:hypothetical protein